MKPYTELRSKLVAGGGGDLCIPLHHLLDILETRVTIYTNKLKQHGLSAETTEFYRGTTSEAEELLRALKDRVPGTR